jgi:hypothetical protein
MWVPLVEDESVYMRIFSLQTGFGMPKYRGSPMVGGSFWGRFVTFAKSMFNKASPHVTDMIKKAQPVVKGMATQAMENAIDSAVSHVTDKLKQSGSGIKGRKKRKKIVKKLCKLPDRI